MGEQEEQQDHEKQDELEEDHLPALSCLVLTERGHVTVPVPVVVLEFEGGWSRVDRLEHFPYHQLHRSAVP